MFECPDSKAPDEVLPGFEDAPRHPWFSLFCVTVAVSVHSEEYW